MEALRENLEMLTELAQKMLDEITEAAAALAELMDGHGGPPAAPAT